MLLMRIARFVVAAFAIAVGVVLAFLPGPAVLFFLLAGGLLASEWLWVARFLDWLELRLRELGEFGRRIWRRLPTLARAAVVVLGVGLSAASTWGVYQLVR